MQATKLRPALVIAIHRKEAIILGIFSKIPDGNLRETWVLISDEDPEFNQTGLKKTSLIRADKIATVNETVFQIRTQYPNQWVLVVNPELDDNLEIIRGEVIANCPNKEESYQQLHLSKDRSSAIEYTGTYDDNLVLI